MLHASVGEASEFRKPPSSHQAALPTQTTQTVENRKWTALPLPLMAERARERTPPGLSHLLALTLGSSRTVVWSGLAGSAIALMLGSWEGRGCGGLWGAGNCRRGRIPVQWTESSGTSSGGLGSLLPWGIAGTLQRESWMNPHSGFCSSLSLT